MKACSNYYQKIFFECIYKTEGCRKTKASAVANFLYPRNALDQIEKHHSMLRWPTLDPGQGSLDRSLPYRFWCLQSSQAQAPELYCFSSNPSPTTNLCINFLIYRTGLVSVPLQNFSESYIKSYRKGFEDSICLTYISST